MSLTMTFLLWAVPLAVYPTSATGSCIEALLRTLSSNAYSFDEGARELILSLDKRLEALGAKRALIVAVYGTPGSGKSELIHRLKEHYGETLSGSSGGAGREVFEAIKEYQRIMVKRNKPWVVVLHVGAERVQPDLGARFLEPTEDTLSEKILGHEIDMHIGILKVDDSTPKSPEAWFVPPRSNGLYDMILINQDAKRR